MLRASIAALIGDRPEAHGVYDEVEEPQRQVYCTVSSVKRSEVYEAMGHGLAPEIVLTLSDAAEYQGETKCRYNSVLYRIMRTYLLKNGGIELTLERSNTDV